jgi:hypothetical protein
MSRLAVRFALLTAACEEAPGYMRAHEAARVLGQRNSPPKPPRAG